MEAVRLRRLGAALRLQGSRSRTSAARDTDNPATKKSDWAKSFIGAPPLKTPVNAKFDVDVVDWFKAQGRGYQSRLNPVLRRYMKVHRKAG